MKDIKRYRVHHKKCNVYEHKSKKPFGNTLSHRARDEAHTEARKQMQTDKNGARKARITHIIECQRNERVTLCGVAASVAIKSKLLDSILVILTSFPALKKLLPELINIPPPPKGTTLILHFWKR